MSSTISKLLEIRKVTEIARKDGRLEMLSTQEQLRSKHIETLEQLQVLTDDNESLRRDIHSLHVKFGVVCDDSIGDIEADVTGNSDDDSLLLRKIHAQDKEIKELKSRLSLAESETRDVKEQSKALRQQEFDTRKKLEKDKSENEVASRKASIASIALYEATNQILQKSLQNRDSELQVWHTSLFC